MCVRATIIMLFRPFQAIHVGNLDDDLPMSICKKTAKELVNIACEYKLDAGLRCHILPFSHYVFLTSQTFLLNLPAETEDLNRGLRILAQTKTLWPAGGLGLFWLPMVAKELGIEFSEETRAILNVLTESERGRMASTAWASAREEEVKVVTEEFLDYWEKAFTVT